MKYDNMLKSSHYKWAIKKIRKMVFGKFRKKTLRHKLKNIDFEIQNMDYKKIYGYGYEEVYSMYKRYNNKPKRYNDYK